MLKHLVQGDQGPEFQIFTKVLYLFGVFVSSTILQLAVGYAIKTDAELNKVLTKELSLSG